eukprot:c15835_g1_i2.p1 GENE.c15835_g1_i2~~c15835_g1_i2.p1  ORF type:complete len:114 (+),score=21.88 c15835_g1_i2:35-376(+)
MQHAQTTTIPDLQSLGVGVEGKSVRVFGKVQSWDAGAQRVMLEHQGEVIRISTQMLDPFPFVPNRMVQFIGECHLDEGGTHVVARIVRNFEGVDVGLYEKAAALRDQFLNNKS